MNKNIQKINTIGKISKIVAIIAAILMGIGCLTMLIGAVTLNIIPKDMITMDLGGSLEMHLNTDKYPLGDEAVIDILTEKFADINTDRFTATITDNRQENGNVTIGINGIAKAITPGGLLDDFSLMCVGVAIYMTVYAVLLVFAARLADALSKCYSPFEDNVIIKMKQFGYSLIPLAIITFFGITVNANGLKFDIKVDVASLLIVAVIAVLIFVFNYGAQLQQEADETV